MNKAWALVIGAILFAVFSLLFNIQTVSLNEDNTLLRKQLNSLRNNNLSLYYQLLDQRKYPVIESRAVSELGMVKPRKIHYISVPAEFSND